MINGEAVGNFLFKLSRYSTKILIKAMAVCMMVYSVANIYMQLNYNLYGGDFIAIAYGITLIVSVIALFTRKVDVFRLVGIFALMLAFQRFYAKLVVFSWDDSDFTIVVNLIFMGMAVNMMITGVSFLIGKVIRRTSMMVSSTIMAVYEFFLLEYFMIPYGITEPWIYYAAMLCLIGMYLCIIGLMDVDSIRYSTKIAKYSKSLESFRNEHQYDRGSAISHEAARALVDSRSPLWKPGKGGPVEAELHFVIEGYSTNANVTVQKWYNDDRLFFTIHDQPGSILFANRFAVDTIQMLDNKVRLVGKDGTDAILWVRG